MTLHENVYQTIKSSLIKSLVPTLTEKNLAMLSTPIKTKGLLYPYFNTLVEKGKQMLQKNPRNIPDFKNASSENLLAYVAHFLTTRGLSSDEEVTSLVKPILSTYPVSMEDEITWTLRINEEPFDILPQEDPSSIFDRLFKHVNQKYSFVTDETFVNILLGMTQVFQTEIIKFINDDAIDEFLHRRQPFIDVDKQQITDKQMKLRSLLESIKVSTLDPVVDVTCRVDEVSVKVSYLLHLKSGGKDIECSIFIPITTLHNTLRLTPGTLQSPNGLKIEEFYADFKIPLEKAQGMDQIKERLMVCYETILDNFDDSSVIRNFEEIIFNEFQKKLCEKKKQQTNGGRGLKKKAAFCKKKWTFKQKGKKRYNLKERISYKNKYRSCRNKTQRN